MISSGFYTIITFFYMTLSILIYFNAKEKTNLLAFPTQFSLLFHRTDVWTSTVVHAMPSLKSQVPDHLHKKNLPKADSQSRPYGSESDAFFLSQLQEKPDWTFFQTFHNLKKCLLFCIFRSSHFIFNFISITSIPHLFHWNFKNSLFWRISFDQRIIILLLKYPLSFV